MNKQAIIDSVGLANYEAAAQLLRTDSARPNYGQGVSNDELSSDLPHEIADDIWKSGESWRDRIELFFSIYDDMPAYGNIMYSKHHYRYFSKSDRDYWWEQVRQRLAGDDLAIKNPLLYSLWCDYFEDSETTLRILRL